MIEHVEVDAEHVTHDDCKRRCRTTQWLIGTILAGIVTSFAGVVIVWGSTMGAAGECKEATATLREHQAASAVVEKRLDRMETKNDRNFERIESRLDEIAERLP